MLDRGWYYLLYLAFFFLSFIYIKKSVKKIMHSHLVYFGCTLLSLISGFESDISAFSADSRAILEQSRLTRRRNFDCNFGLCTHYVTYSFFVFLSSDDIF